MTKDEKKIKILALQSSHSHGKGCQKEQILIIKYDTYIQRVCKNGGERHLFCRIKEGFKEEVTCERDPVIVFLLYCLSHLKFFPFCTSSLYLVFTFSCKHILFSGLTCWVQSEETAISFPGNELSGHYCDLKYIHHMLWTRVTSFSYFLWLTAVLSNRPINADYLGQSQLLKD